MLDTGCWMLDIGCWELDAQTGKRLKAHGAGQKRVDGRR
ncbi:hypothetical protein D1BOALGB6SA_9767 [Olavius sp. associated proteobacterium Delta 1]|nr:hypothetical protein D1BOALGB6SA_9767 [Olavius sp. associated proteobacterium Delta 1]